MSCSEEKSLKDSISVAMSDMLYVNSDNEQNYSFGGKCIGDGLEISYSIGNEMGTVSCENGNWTVSGLDLSGEIDGTLTAELSVTNGKEVATASAVVTKDTVRPTLSSQGIGVPSDSTYGADDSLIFTIDFSENVFVRSGDPVPHLELTIGTSTRYARYMMGSGTTELIFSYTVSAGDADNDGIELGVIHFTLQWKN